MAKKKTAAPQRSDGGNNSNNTTTSFAPGEIVLRNETNATALDQVQRLRQRHRRDPFNTTGNRIKTGNRIIARVTDPGDESRSATVLYEEIETHLSITISGEITESDTWIDRRRITKETGGAIMVTPLITWPGIDGSEQVDPILAAYPLMHGARADMKRAARLVLGPDQQATTLAPILQHWTGGPAETKKCGARHYAGDPEDYRDMLAIFAGASTAADVAANAFGAEHVRRDLVKAVATAQLPILRLVLTLWDEHMPVDWAIDALTRPTQPDVVRGWTYYNSDALLMRIMAGLDRASRGRLLKRTITTAEWRHVADTEHNLRRLVRELRPFDAPAVQLEPDWPTTARTWKELETHVNYACQQARKRVDDMQTARDEQAAVARAQWLHTAAGAAWVARRRRADAAALAHEQKNAARKLAQLEKEQAAVARTYTSALETNTRLNAEQADGLRVVIASRQSQLRDWSVQMGNCIAGYDLDIARTHTLLLGVYDDTDDLVANAEIRIGFESEEPSLSQLEVRRGRSHQYEKVRARIEQLIETIAEARPSVA